MSVLSKHRLLPTIVATVFLIMGCKGSGSSSGPSIPQTLTNWTWVADSNLANSLGYYTSLGTATTTGQPSGRYNAMSWLDASGQFWLFSGTGASNDLWKFTPSALQWTWIAGNNPATSQLTAGVYTGASQTPGQRYGGSTWIDGAGNLWLFGGYGADVNGLNGFLNDEWYFSPTSNSWTYAGGSQTGGSLATYQYGTQGVPAAGNLPAPRSGAANWQRNGQFYLFGGQTFTGGNAELQNDLWTLNPANQTWTWISGPQSLNASGQYGTINVASATNQPGARQSATTWTDPSGNFWMFGGTGIDSVGNAGQLNDLWEYNTASNQWIWKNGANTINAIGNYGTNAIAATTNQPGARAGAVGWTDTSGNLWLFGGTGINSTGTQVVLNDLWEYVLSSGQWVWQNGSYNGNVGGSYGTLNVMAASNDPGSRFGASVFTDSAGNFWMFAGNGYDASGTNGRLADFWKFVP